MAAKLPARAVDRKELLRTEAEPLVEEAVRLGAELPHGLRLVEEVVDRS